MKQELAALDATAQAELHWMGRFGDEATLFRLAGQIEAARPWSRRPPVCA